MALADLISHSLGEDSAFNWPWFIELVVCGILVLFFLFYFNRLFATLISYGLRAYVWHAYRVWIDIQAIQISLLGGRLFFKGVRYHGENETILIHSGFVTWQYWLRSVRQVDLTRYEDGRDNVENEKQAENSFESSRPSANDKDEELGATKKAQNGEARISVYVHGVEWFIYNRTPMYDAILQNVDETKTTPQPVRDIEPEPVKTGSEKRRIGKVLHRRQTPDNASSVESANNMGVDMEKEETSGQQRPRSLSTASDVTEDFPQTSAEVSFIQMLLVRLLPIQIECSRAAISMGNEHTKALLVTTVTRAKGHIDAGGCGPHDIFRQLFDFSIEHPVVQMRPNPDYRTSQMTSAERLIRNVSNSHRKPKWWKLQFNLARHRHNAVHGLRNLMPWLRSSVESLHYDSHDKDQSTYKSFAGADPDDGPWHGVNRYLDDDEDDEHQAWINVDYGRFSTILDCPEIHFLFYWDIPGRVAREHLETPSEHSRQDINGASPPAYGIDLTVKGGQINYGPWADRLRAELQAIFIPVSFKSVVPATTLAIASWRQSTNMTIRVDIEEEVSLRVPTKESSKDWRWRGRATAVRDAAALRKQREKKHFRLRRGQKGILGPDIRPFGWLSFSVAPDSSVRYEMDMVACSSGFRNQLHLDLKDTKVTSSVNHDILWRCSNQKVRADLSNPLGWNAQHLWRFDVSNDSMELFLLRDHMFLLTDLIADFTAGQKADYMTFVPFRYSLGIDFSNLRVYLSANDYNIIDNSSDLENNTFLVLGAQALRGDVDIPLQYFSPSQSSVVFRAEAENGYLDLKASVWNTLHTFANYESMALLKKLEANGSYNYCAGTSPQLSDSLVMNIIGKSFRIYLQGFLIRYFMNVKENYFGEDLHFRTFEEYRSALDSNNHLTVEADRPQSKKDNDLDVILTVRAEDVCALIPANIYDRRENVRIDLMSGEADMRFTNYYMDLQVNSSPIEVSLETVKDEASQEYSKTTGCQLYVDCVTVYGHRLFGAPPAEPTYVCNWDFDIGTISGECSTQFVRTMIASIQSLIFTLDDDENALPAARPEELHDVTFLRARAGAVRVWLVVNDTALLLEISSFQLTSNDWAKDEFSKHMQATIPSITVAAIETALARHQNEKIVPTLLCLQTSVQLALIDKKVEFRLNRDLQQRHVRLHDSRTHRADCLLRRRNASDLSSYETAWSRESPSLPVPELPAPPMHANANKNIRDYKANHTSNTLRRSSSFLSSRSGSSKRRTRNYPKGPRTHLQEELTLQSENSRSVSRSQSTQHPIRNHPGDNDREPGQIASVDDFKSPWIPPYFSLQKVIPDTRALPIQEPAPVQTTRTIFTDRADEELPATEESLSHAAVFCKLTNGISASCTPAFLTVVSQLIQESIPKDSGSLFDALQRETVANIKALTTVLTLQIDDFAIELPRAAIRLVNTHEGTTHANLTDKYDVVINNTKLMLRTSPSMEDQARGRPRSNAIMTHASIASIEVAVVETGYQKLHSAAGLRASLGGAQLWLSLHDEVRMGVQLKNFGLASQGRSIGRFSSLIDRTSAMVDGMIRNFEPQHHDDDIRHLIYHLIHKDTHAADPVLLTRPSYVLRSANEHVRLNDSWKILVILRWRLAMLTAKARSVILQHQSCNFKERQDVAREEIVAFFDNLKAVAGDLMADGSVMTAVFGNTGVDVLHPQQVVDLEATILLGEGTVVLDPGPNHSKILVQGCDLVFTQKPVPSDPERSPRAHTQQRAHRIVQSWIGRVAVDLNWELVELVESLASHTLTTIATKDKNVATPTPAADQTSSSDDLSLTVGTDNLTMRLTTINLKMEANATNLKTSFVMQQSHRATAISLLLASTSADSKIMDRHKILLHWRLQAPNVYASYQQENEKSNEADTIRLAANCKTLRFNMEEDIVYLVDVTSSVVKDEVKTIQDIVRLFDQVGPPQAQKSPSMAAKSKPKSVDIHFAFRVSNYMLRFALLPALHYIIAGEVGQTSVVPHGKSNFVIHLDAGSSNHILLKPDASIRDPTCVVQMPPVNGKIDLGLSPNEIRVKAHSTLERVIIEAAMVHTCFDAVYRPENATFFKSATEAVENLQIVIEDIMQKDESKPTKPILKENVVRALFYSAHVVFEGFIINCDTLEESNPSHHAKMSLGVRQTILRIKNIRKDSDVPFAQPQFELNLPTIMLGLDRQLKKQQRSAGKFVMGLLLTGTTDIDEKGDETQSYRAVINSVKLDLFTETAAAVVDTINYLQSRIRTLTSDEDRKHMKSMRRLTIASQGGKVLVDAAVDAASDDSSSTSSLLDSTFSLDLNRVQVRWILEDDGSVTPGRRVEDLVFSIRKIDLKTQREGSARLTILDLQLQIVPKSQKDPTERTANSALLPEMAFKAAHLSTKKDRRFAFQAAGKALDLRLAADGILPLSAVQKSLARAAADLRTMQTAEPASTETPSAPTKSLLGNKRLSSLLVDADFAGAVLTVTPRTEEQQTTAFGMLKGPKRSRAGRYGQAVKSGNADQAVLRAPGVAMKVEYRDTGATDPTLSTEVKVAGSNNILAPTVVPLILEIYSSIKEIIGEDGSETDKAEVKTPAQKPLPDAADPNPDPTAILGGVRLDASLWIQRQEFGLTCQPVAKVQATAKFDDIFITLNTVQDDNQDRFFSVILKFNNLEAAVQHVFSRESTASFEVESIIMSLMNSKHVSTKNGISAILNISPMKANINAKQMQDFLLFREIWYPAELRVVPKASEPGPTATESQMYAMQRYEELTGTAALPWHAIVSVQELEIQVDFGSGLGKSTFAITKLWASSKKSSDWEQNLCVGFDKVGVDSSGRMSGLVELRNFHARTSIKWPAKNDGGNRAPLVQASMGFDHLRVKAAFDYQPFAVVEVSSFDFLMYNVRPDTAYETDRLVGILDGGKVQVFCISTAAGQVLAIVQAFERLIQEKKEAYQDSLHELDRLLRRKSVFPSGTYASNPTDLVRKSDSGKKTSHLLQTDVVVTLKAVDVGAFPNSFFDNQILKIEAVDVQARFAVATVDNKIQSGLGMSLGEVRVALSAVGRTNTKALGEVEISEVIGRATTSKGGTIMKVPRVVASMQTWQGEQTNLIEYIFRSTFQGKVDVGWNYSRISFIRGMWDTHSHALAQRLGKPLPPAAVKITTGHEDEGATGSGQGKITAVVNMPQTSKFEYVAIEPPVIDTPQLRDMGEATPPLEWIGLHREKLPNVTHSIVIVTLLEVAKEVEDAYTRILGTG